jgi:hypothetical protein
MIPQHRLRTGIISTRSNLPRPIGQPCLLLPQRHQWMTGDRDPTSRAENVSRVIDAQYGFVGMPGENAGQTFDYRRIAG